MHNNAFDTLNKLSLYLSPLQEHFQSRNNQSNKCMFPNPETIQAQEVTVF